MESVCDLETAKQMLVLYEQENLRLHQRISQLLHEIAQLRGESQGPQRTVELSKLQEQLGTLQRKVFGHSSEKRSCLPGTKDEKPPKKKRGHGPNTQDELSVVEHTYRLEEAERSCPSCGAMLQEMSGVTEDSEAITTQVQRYVVVKVKRQKYRCRCGEAVVTAPGPVKHLAQGRYLLPFAIQVAVDKYADHLPLERQSRRMARQGLWVDSQTLWDQLDALAPHLEPTYHALRTFIVGADVLGVDETWWRLMKGKGSKKWWAWGLVTPNACHYTLADSRSGQVAQNVLEGFEGTVLCDGYKAYERVARERPDVRLAHCWAHVRRYFVQAAEHYPVAAQPALELIASLFEVERELNDPLGMEGDAKLEAANLRQQTRNERSRPLLEKLRLVGEHQRASPHHALRKAIQYMQKHWQGLTAFLDDPYLSIDNNATERALRGMVVGRKNHYGSRSQRGTYVAAILYSLVESAKLCQLDPFAYLLEVATRAIQKPGAVLLPHDFARLQSDANVALKP